MSKKQKKRDTFKYPALVKEVNLKSRQEELENDYIDKLSDEDKQWLNKFNEEYVNANLDRKKIKNNIHNTKKLKKACDKKNNDKKKCAFNKARITGSLRYFSDMEGILVDESYEDTLINELDDKLFNS